MIYYGIDPDLDQTGVAIYAPEEPVPLIFESFKPEEASLYDFEKKSIIYVEAGWLNKGVYHLTKNMNPPTAAEVGRKVGLNHGVGQMIARVLRDRGFTVKLVRPVNSKISPKTFLKMTGAKLSQDMIDAAMLIYGHWSKHPKFKNRV